MILAVMDYITHGYPEKGVEDIFLKKMVLNFRQKSKCEKMNFHENLSKKAKFLQKKRRHGGLRRIVYRIAYIGFGFFPNSSLFSFL